MALTTLIGAFSGVRDSRDLIHWESQGATREASETGQRYQHHVARGTSTLLFARLRTDDRAFWFSGRRPT